MALEKICWTISIIKSRAKELLCKEMDTLSEDAKSSADVGKGMSSEKSCSGATASAKQECYLQALQNIVSKQKEIVLDFTSLKACLDPQKETSGDHVVRLLMQGLIPNHK